MRIEMGKKYQTRSGQPVRLYSFQGGGDDPIHGAFERYPGGEWQILSWTTEGQAATCGRRTDLDLVPVREKGWINIYPPGSDWDGNLCDERVFRSEAEADEHSALDRLCCIEIAYTAPARD